MSAIPLQQECNPNDPEEHALWALMGLPGLEEQAPMIMPPAVLRKWSKRLYDIGFRHHPEHQTIKYVPPHGAEHWLSGSGGVWVPIDADLPPEVTTPDISHLSMGEKRELVKRLQDEGYIPTPQQGPEQDTAEVSTHGD